MITFYKGVLIADLRDSYIPGTVTTDFMLALDWKERIQSNKRRDGVVRHSRSGAACVVEIMFDDQAGYLATRADEEIKRFRKQFPEFNAAIFHIQDMTSVHTLS